MKGSHPTTQFNNKFGWTQKIYDAAQILTEAELDNLAENSLIILHEGDQSTKAKITGKPKSNDKGSKTIKVSLLGDLIEVRERDISLADFGILKYPSGFWSRAGNWIGLVPDEPEPSDEPIPEE